MTGWKKIEKEDELDKIMGPFETKGKRYGKRQALRARSMRKMVSLLQNGSTEDECAGEIGVSSKTIQSWRNQLEEQREKIIIEDAKERKRLKEVERKTRRLILLGIYMEYVIQQEPKRKAGLWKGLDGFLEHDRDRELFGLPLNKENPDGNPGS